jgi:hypothetical protein
VTSGNRLPVVDAVVRRRISSRGPVEVSDAAAYRVQLREVVSAAYAPTRNERVASSGDMLAATLLVVRQDSATRYDGTGSSSSGGGGGRGRCLAPGRSASSKSTAPGYIRVRPFVRASAPGRHRSKAAGITAHRRLLTASVTAHRIAPRAASRAARGRPKCICRKAASVRAARLQQDVGRTVKNADMQTADDSTRRVSKQQVVSSSISLRTPAPSAYLDGAKFLIQRSTGFKGRPVVAHRRKKNDDSGMQFIR